MGDLSKNFDRSEFACAGENCCDHTAALDPALIESLQALRDAVGHPIVISSGFRCNRHNKAEGGALLSFHILGMAADISCPGLTTEELALQAEKITRFRNGGIGTYATWVHVDVRQIGRARWKA